MRILHIGFGTAPHLDELWMRDAALLGGLRDRGHEIRIAPFLAPAPLDDYPGLRSGGVRFGRLNAWLDAKLPPWGRGPRLLRRVLDAEWLLRPAARFGLGPDPLRLGVRAESVASMAFAPGSREGGAALRAFAAAGPDAVSLASPFLLPLAPLLRQHLGGPVLCAMGGEEEQVEELPAEPRRDLLDRLRRNAPAAERFLVPDGAGARHAAGFLHLPPGRLAVVPPSVRLSEETADPAPHAERSVFRIGFSAGVTRANGADVLIEAAGRLLREAQGKLVRLELAGPLPDRAFWRELRDRAAAHGLGTTAQYLGELPGLVRRRWLRELDVVCLPAREGGAIGIGLLEALAEGVPAVATDRGLASALEEETEGVRLVPPEDPGRTMQALRAFLRQPATRITTGRAAAAVVRERYSPDAAAAAFEAALSSPLKN